MDATTLWRKTALKAALSPVNLTAGVAAAAASVWLRSPWPLAAWAVFALAWVLIGSRSPRYREAALSDLRKESESREAGERAALAQRVEAQLQEPPLRGWVQAGMLPDYLRVYRRLVEIREQVVRVARERAEVEALTREEMIDQLDGMLTSYLHFVRERVNYLQILNNIRSEGDADGVGSGVAATPSAPVTTGTSAPPPAGFESGRWVAVGKLPPKSGAPRPAASGSEAPGLPSFERRLAEVEGKIARLRELAAQEPVTASTREWHIGILEKQRDLLRECRERDQRVVAQLGVFTDVFEIILGRVSAAQFSPQEIVGTMAPVVEQIEETERFIATLRPAMDELMGRTGGV